MSTRPCYVYAIGRLLPSGDLDGPVKFGVAEDPAKRLKQLQTGSSCRLAVLAAILMPERKFAAMLEKGMHAFFAENRLSGEWFGVSAFEAAGALAAITREMLLGLGGHGEDLERALHLSGASDLMTRWGREHERRAQ